MNKKLVPLLFILVLSLVLSSCAAAPSITLGSSVQNKTSSADSVENKLGFGIIKLEGTALSVTTTQAESILVLWKAVSSLSKEINTANAEMDSLYAQIKESLTAEQIEAIQQMDIPQDVSEMVRVSSTSATKTSSSKSSSSNPSSGNAPMGGGGAPMDGGGGSMDLVAGQSTAAQNTSSTKTSTQSTLSSSSNVTLADTVVSLLKTKISS